MPHQTDQHLKSYLDTNQMRREQMCLAILATDRRFSDLQPSHPRGGPDGGRDIEGVFKQDQRAFAAVGFVNQANDSKEHKRTIKRKFVADVNNALSNALRPDVFFFLTNINLTITEKSELVSHAGATGFTYCEIMDRERLRIALDSPDGFSIRFQYLGIPLSETEQASFFAKWGDDIQSVISTGFQRVEKTLDRLLFLQEASDVLSSLTFDFEFDRPYAADEIGHFRAFCSIYLKEPKHRILGILVGSSDKSHRMTNNMKDDFRTQQAGIKHGISEGQWEHYFPADVEDENVSLAEEEEEAGEKYKQVSASSGVGMDSAKSLYIRYDHDDHLFRFFPRLALRDINECIFLFALNKSLVEKIKCIHIYASGYKLQEISFSDCHIDTTPFEWNIPVEFTDEELADAWVRIRPKRSSTFRISFAEQTPKKMSFPQETPNSLAKKIQF